MRQDPTLEKIIIYIIIEYIILSYNNIYKTKEWKFYLGLEGGGGDLSVQLGVYQIGWWNTGMA